MSLRHPLLEILTVFVLALSTPVKAQSFKDGIKAFEAGDYATALKIFLPFAEKGGRPEAQFKVGVIYAEGKVGPPDFVKAQVYWMLAAYQGFADAQFNLGVLNASVDLGPPRHAHAVRWWKMAAEQGHAEAQYNLGVKHLKGEGVLQDFVTAHMWINIANAQGVPEAQKVLKNLNKLLKQNQIANAQARARTCLNSNYQDCD